MSKSISFKDQLSFSCLYPTKKISNEIFCLANRFEKRILRKGETDNLLQKVSPVFVLSPGRSGTKTLSALMKLAPLIDAHHEPEPRLFDICASYLAFMNEGKEIYPEFWEYLIGYTRDAMIFKAYYNNQVYFESNNRITLFASFFDRHYPLCRFIHLYRHPYDFVRSAMRRNYYNGHSGDFARIQPTVEDIYYKYWKDMSQLEKCAWLWNKTNEHILKFLEKLPKERKLFLKSEELFNESKKTISSLYEFVIDSPLHSQKMIEKILAKKLNQQVTGYFPKPEAWSNSQLNSVKKIVENTMSRLGYGH